MSWQTLPGELFFVIHGALPIRHTHAFILFSNKIGKEDRRSYNVIPPEAEWRDLETGQYAPGRNLFLKDPSTSFRSCSTPLGMTGAFYSFSCYFNLSIVLKRF